MSTFWTYFVIVEILTFYIGGGGVKIDKNTNFNF